MLTSTDFSGLVNDRFFKNFFPIPASNSLSLGMVTPDFELTDITDGDTVKLSDRLGRRPVILAFTRIFTEKQYCPFCFPHIKELRDRYQEFVDRDLDLILITSTDEAQSQIVRQDLDLKMTLLSNSDCRVFRAYQTGQALGAPLPAQFVLDRQGRLRYKHLFSFLDHNASVDTLLQAAAIPSSTLHRHLSVSC
jgi:peroxiredoxin